MRKVITIIVMIVGMVMGLAAALITAFEEMEILAGWI